MTMDDYQAVMNIWSESEGLSLRDADSPESIGAYLARNPGTSFVAEHQGKVVGTVLAGTDGRRGYLQHLAVSESHRSQGIGQMLIEKAVEGLAAAGIAKTHLFVFCENEAAQRFYERLGWFARDEVRMYSFNASDNQNV
ncbi:GNAT family N-acetyltransferase [Photobacterium sp. CCB-ST2H9]|uniref:GNAT family N-acetyltransferase n=1 Tax=unclassified Photobacterium TaxID=2628852 RepID=UPI0020056CFB|nr:GNAT family N-acetyltransferase [Photobacterium sp. CCB-ST2H9]UTM58922.1 GNAT family N-acetyltransferase [Photobacterium sp. CCB-ST2H9]